MVFKNQYVVSKNPAVVNYGNSFEWNGLYVYLGSETNFFLNEKCLIIGKAVSSLSTEKKLNEIGKDLESTSSIEESIHYLDYLAGRYVVFIENGNEIFFLTDACGFKRGLFFAEDGNKFLTSSEEFSAHLLGLSVFADEETSELMGDEEYKSKESPWFGVTSYDKRFKFVLPNHYLTWSDFSLNRMPAPEGFGDDNIADAASMLKVTMENLGKNYSLIQPVTAGVDSRILLAASKSLKHSISYYVFGEKDSEHEDVRIPKSLSIINDSPIEVVSPLPVDDEFKEKMAAEVFGARFLPKTGNIYHHFKNTPRDHVNINGNGAEIFRSFYGVSALELSPRSLSILAGVNKWKILRDRVEEWYRKTGALSYAKNNRISITDLFYWEQRMAIWGSMYPLEQDIAIDEVSPFSNRRLIFTMLREPSRNRVPRHFRSSINVIKKLNPVLLDVPVNPDSSNSIASYVKKHSLLRVLAMKIRR